MSASYQLPVWEPTCLSTHLPSRPARLLAAPQMMHGAMGGQQGEELELHSRLQEEVNLGGHSGAASAKGRDAEPPLNWTGFHLLAKAFRWVGKRVGGRARRGGGGGGGPPPPPPPSSLAQPHRAEGVGQRGHLPACKLPTCPSVCSHCVAEHGPCELNTTPTPLWLQPPQAAGGAGWRDW